MDEPTSQERRKVSTVFIHEYKCLTIILVLLKNALKNIQNLIVLFIQKIILLLKILFIAVLLYIHK